MIHDNPPGRNAGSIEYPVMNPYLRNQIPAPDPSLQHQRRHGYAGHAHTQDKNAECVSRNVDPVHEQGNLESDFGIAHGAKQSRAALVHGQKGEGQSGNHQIGDGAVHDVLDILDCKRDDEGYCSAADVSHAEDLLIELPLALEVITQNRTFTPGTYEVERYGAYSNCRMMRNYKTLKGALSEIDETCKTDEDRKRAEWLRSLFMSVMDDDPWRIIKDIKYWEDTDPEWAKFREIFEKHKKLEQDWKILLARN